MFLHTSVGKTNAFLWNECRTNVLIIQHLGRISGRRDLISVLSSVFEINVTTPSLEVAESLAYKTSQFILAMCDTHSEASNLMAVPGPSSSSFLLHMPPPTPPPPPFTLEDAFQIQYCSVINSWSWTSVLVFCDQNLNFGIKEKWKC